uniref:Guanine nucleotide-binding protein subunit gamma n=1 Tax=Malurus cyaneus samueli TaxID=2593467 RepID=A0A8C5TUH8_9PASS
MKLTCLSRGSSVLKTFYLWDPGLVPQLRTSATLSRVGVSQAAAELQQYCMQNACKDALLVGVPAGSNPFREPRSCALL